MTRDLERRIRKLESSLPPLLTADVSWMFGVLWFAVAYYFGKPSPDEKPFAAFVRALGYADRDELNHAMLREYREVAIRICSAEAKVCAKFDIDIPSLEYERCDVEKLLKALNRMEVGLPRPYRDQLKVALTRKNNLGLMRVRGDLFSYFSCFA
jgi:hypothetical protein